MKKLEAREEYGDNLPELKKDSQKFFGGRLFSMAAADYSFYFSNAHPIGSDAYEKCIDYDDDQYPDDRRECFKQEVKRQMQIQMQTSSHTSWPVQTEVEAKSTMTVTDTKEYNEEEKEKVAHEQQNLGTCTDNVHLCKYEQQRLKNIEDNKAKLRMLGLGETLVQQHMPTRKRKKHEKKHKHFEPKVLPKRTTRSNIKYNYDDDEDDEDEDERGKRKRQAFVELRSTEPKRARVHAGEVCTLNYSDFPSWFRDNNPLNKGHNASGYLYVHKVSSGYQVQIHVTFENGTKRLIHHGIFQDIKTAALAQAVASADTRVGKTSLGGRHLLESVMTASARMNSEEGSDDELGTASMRI